MSSIGSNQSSKRWELVSIAECESSGLLVTFFMAWSPGRRFNDGDSRLVTPETTPPSIPTNPATGPPRVIGVVIEKVRRLFCFDGIDECLQYFRGLPLVPHDRLGHAARNEGISLRHPRLSPFASPLL